MAINANESKEEKGSQYGQFVTEQYLFSVFQEYFSVPSRMEGRQMVDNLELANLPPQTVRQSGQLPGKIGYLSDY